MRIRIRNTALHNLKGQRPEFWKYKGEAGFRTRTPDFITVQIAPEMRDGADLVGEDDHGVLAGLGLEYVPDELCEGGLVAHEAQLSLPRPTRQVAPGQQRRKSRHLCVFKSFVKMFLLVRIGYKHATTLPMRIRIRIQPTKTNSGPET